MDPRLSKSLYRSTLRILKECFKDNPNFRIMSGLDYDMWGSGRHLRKEWLQQEQNSQVSSVFGNKKDLEFLDEGEQENKNSLSQILKKQYQHPCTDTSNALQNGFSSMQLLNYQKELNKRTSCTITDGIEVTATSHQISNFIGKHPYVFCYRIRIRNIGEDTVQITHRSWKISDKKGGTTEVPKWADALVGHKPSLKPGQTFEYYSGTDLATPEGVMEGALLASKFDSAGNAINNSQFEVLVSSFNLISHFDPQASKTS